MLELITKFNPSQMAKLIMEKLGYPIPEKHLITIWVKALSEKLDELDKYPLGVTK